MAYARDRLAGRASGGVGGQVREVSRGIGEARTSPSAAARRAGLTATTAAPPTVILPATDAVAPLPPETPVGRALATTAAPHRAAPVPARPSRRRPPPRRPPAHRPAGLRRHAPAHDDQPRLPVALIFDANLADARPGPPQPRAGRSGAPPLTAVLLPRRRGRGVGGPAGERRRRSSTTRRRRPRRTACMAVAGGRARTSASTAPSKRSTGAWMAERVHRATSSARPSARSASAWSAADDFLWVVVNFAG